MQGVQKSVLVVGLGVVELRQFMQEHTPEDFGWYFTVDDGEFVLGASWLLRNSAYQTEFRAASLDDVFSAWIHVDWWVERELAAAAFLHVAGGAL